jgi:O-antigen ligase
VPESKKVVLISGGLASIAGISYLTLLFVAGFLTNFLPTGDVNTGTILLYSSASVLSFIGLLCLLNPIRKRIAIAVVTILALSGLTVLKATLDSNPVSQRMQEITIFFLGVWPCLFLIQIDSSKVRERFLKTLSIGLFGLSAFGLFQGIYSNALPLTLFVLRGDNRFNVGEDQFRPTGLTGNPIIFSSILVFASAYFLAQWLEKRRSRFLLALSFSLAANYLTYTRASIALVIPVLILVWLLSNRFRIKHKMIVAVAIILAAAGGLYLFVSNVDLIIVQRFQTSSTESLNSTLDHFVQISNANAAIASSPWLGAGMGSQGNSVGPDNVIITDGAWWIILLEFGIPLTILIVTVLLLALVPIAKFVLRPESTNRSLAIATLSFHAYVVPAGFINSAILGHISFGLYWVVLGLSFAAASGGYSSLRSRQTLVPVSDSWKGTPVKGRLAI